MSSSPDETVATGASKLISLSYSHFLFSSSSSFVVFLGGSLQLLLPGVVITKRKLIDCEKKLKSKQSSCCAR